VLVRDGSADRSDHADRLPPTARVLFSGPGVQADDIIERLLAEAPDSTRLTVVSSDRRLRDAAGFHHAESIPSRRFAEELAQDAAKRARRADDALPRDAVARWLAEFGLIARHADGAQADRAAPAARSLPTDDDIDRQVSEIDIAALLADGAMPTPPVQEPTLKPPPRPRVRRRWH
jgi:hypothetical protein